MAHSSKAKASRMSAAHRRQLARTMMEPSSVEDVVDAIATFAKRSDAKVYVERRADGLRWSPAHPGGPYAILREVARFLDLDHHTLVVGSAALNGTSVAAPKPRRMPKPAAWSFMAPSVDKNAVMKTLARLTTPDRRPHPRSREQTFMKNLLAGSIPEGTKTLGSDVTKSTPLRIWH